MRLAESGVPEVVEALDEAGRALGIALASTFNLFDFQSVVLTAALHHGWMAVHFRRALQKSGRYSTPVQGMKGSPDLTLARDGIVLLAELKTNTGALRPEQRQWRQHLGNSWRLWRPRDWADILTELETGEPPRKAGTA